MSSLPEIEESIRRLSAEERIAFRAWFAEFDAAEWDREFEADIASGRLDWLLDEARSEVREGRSTKR